MLHDKAACSCDVTGTAVGGVGFLAGSRTHNHLPLFVVLSSVVSVPVVHHGLTILS